MIGRDQSHTHFPFQVRNRAQRDRHAEQGFGGFLHAAFAHAVATGEIRQGCGQPGSDRVFANRRRNRFRCDFAAARTGARMPLVFRDHGDERRQLDNLMSNRQRVVRTGFLRQFGTAMLANFGDQRESITNSIGRQELFEMRGMTGLSSRLATGRGFRGFASAFCKCFQPIGCLSPRTAWSRRTIMRNACSVVRYYGVRNRLGVIAPRVVDSWKES